MPHDNRHTQQRSKNVTTLIALVALIAVLFVVTIIKIKTQSL